MFWKNWKPPKYLALSRSASKWCQLILYMVTGLSFLCPFLGDSRRAVQLFINLSVSIGSK